MSWEGKYATFGDSLVCFQQIADTAISAVLPDYLHFSPDLLDDLGVYSQVIVKLIENATSNIL